MQLLHHDHSLIGVIGLRALQQRVSFGGAHRHDDAVRVDALAARRACYRLPLDVHSLIQQGPRANRGS